MNEKTKKMSMETWKRERRETKYERQIRISHTLFMFRTKQVKPVSVSFTLGIDSMHMHRRYSAPH